MKKYSQSDLIGKELALVEGRQSFFSRLGHEYRKNGKVRVNVVVPTRLFMRIGALIDHLPSNDYIFEVHDTFVMIANDLLQQFGEKVNAKALYHSLSASEGKYFHRHDGETEYLDYTFTETVVVTVPLMYKTVLAMEWIADDMAKYAEERFFTVEDVLRILFTEFALQIRKGELPDISKQYNRFARSGLA